MKAIKIVPATYPDTIDDAQPGVTFFSSTPELEGIALLKMGRGCGANAVRLDNGEALRLLEKTHIRIVSLDADTCDENW